MGCGSTGVMLEDLLRRAGAGCARAGKGRVRYPTARGWVRRVRAVELEGGVPHADRGAGRCGGHAAGQGGRFAPTAIGAAFGLAAGLPGWRRLGG
jgi:hypothetical protein